MRICVFGAGAIGGLIAARLAIAGEDVTVIGRGPQLGAIKAKGIALHWQDGRVETARVKAVETAPLAGAQDLVVLAVKAHSLERAALTRRAARCQDHGDDATKRHALVVFSRNMAGALDGTQLNSLDPRGALRD